MKIDALALDRLQQEKGINNKKLAQLVGIGPTAISNLRNRSTTRPLTAMKLAKALGVELSEILPKEER